MELRRHIAAWWLALAIVVATPILVDAALFADYAASYSGVCGPHPTDIPARPCSYSEYLGDFLGDAFAVVGLVVIDAVVVVFSAVIMSVAVAIDAAGASLARRP